MALAVWGTALAWLLGRGGVPVTIACRDASQAAAIQAKRRNARYLPELEIPACVAATAGVASAVAAAELCVAAVPAKALRPLLETVCGAMPGDAAVLIAAKGLEIATGMRPSEVALSVGGDDLRDRLAVLSGPNLAGEVVKEVPTTAVIASWNSDLARELQALFSAPFFRVYTNPDVTGVELGGALKNPVAIAAGISDGLRFGNNTKAALITRGLAEITRLGRACAPSGDLCRPFGAGRSGRHLPEPDEPQLPARRGARQRGGAPRSARRHRTGGRGRSDDGRGLPAGGAAWRGNADHRELRQVLYDGKPPLDAVTSLMTREYRGEDSRAD